jgi:hypothetical protein
MNEKPSSSSRYIPTDVPGLVRDTHSQAIINTDMQELARYRDRVKNHNVNQAKLDSINNVREDIDVLKDEMGEIKTLLKQIILLETKENDTNAS